LLQEYKFALQKRLRKSYNHELKLIHRSPYAAFRLTDVGKIQRTQ